MRLLLKPLLFIFLLLLASIPTVSSLVPNEQFSENGDVVMNVVYDRPVVVRNDGVQAHFRHSFESRGVKDEWTLVTCPLPSRDRLPPQALNGLRNVPIFSEEGNPHTPDFIDMSGGCLRMDFTAGQGDRFKIGQASTVIEIQNSTAEFVITPEYVTCQYLVCESYIKIKNLNTESISFPALSIFVQAEKEVNTTIESLNLDIPVQVEDVTIINETFVSSETITRGMPIPQDIRTNETLTIGAGETALFRIQTEFPEAQHTFKYNVSLFYAGQTFLIDPFFTTREANFSAGTFTTTFLDPGGFVELPLTFTNGTYYSEIFDTQSQANLTNMTWWQEVNYGVDLPDFGQNESGHFITTVNMTDIVALFHFDNTSGENNSYARDFVTGIFDLHCDPGECPTLVSDGVFNKSYYFDGSNDHFHINDHGSAVNLSNPDTNSFSISFWVNGTNPGNDQIISKRDTGTGWEIGVRSTKIVRFLIDEAGAPALFIESNTDVMDGQWHHVVAVRDTENAVLRLYVDGKEDATPVNDGTILTLNNTEELSVGADPLGGAAFKGQIDEGSAWLVALSPERVREQYLRGGVTLTPYVRSCDDAFCFNDELVTINDSSTAFLGINDNERYFQYAFNFTSRYGEFSPFLYNVTIGYEASEPVGGLVIGECPQTSSDALLLWIVVLLSFAFMFLSFHTGAGFFGVFGGILLLVSSVYIVGCAEIIGFSIGAFGALVVLGFLLGLFRGNKGYMGDR